MSKLNVDSLNLIQIIFHEKCIYKSFTAFNLDGNFLIGNNSYGP